MNMNEMVALTEASILALCDVLLEAKRREDEAKELRINTENEIVRLLGARDEGSETHKFCHNKIVITAKLTRSLDVGIWESIKDRFPVQFHPIKYKPEINLTMLRSLESQQPEIFQQMSQAIIVKPAKTSVTLSVIDKE